MGISGVRADSITASLVHYAQVSLKGIGNSQLLNPAISKSCFNENTGQKKIVETLVTLLPSTNNFTAPLNFLFGMMRLATMQDANLECRLELESRISFKLEMASLDDLLIPSARTGDFLFDVDTIHRILVCFLQRVEEGEEYKDEECGYDSAEGLGSPSHDGSCLLEVGRLVDAYLAEIGPDPYLSVAKYISVAGLLPDYARVIDDGLYRAIDIYLKAHPSLNELDCKKLCTLIDCEKLSQKACNHSAQNDRLPVRLVVRVLYFEQLRLKNALTSGSCGDGLVLSSQKISSGIPSAAISPRETCFSEERKSGTEATDLHQFE